MAAPAARAGDVITTHRLSAALASEAVTEAVATCAKQGYRVSAVVLDIHGVTQAVLRGDGASVTSLDASHDKAYCRGWRSSPSSPPSLGSSRQGC